MTDPSAGVRRRQVLAALVLGGAGGPLTSGAARAQTTALSLEAARGLHATPASRYATIDGVDIHYRDEGAGPAVLLVHGTYGDLEDWDGWMPFMRGFRVVRLDMPGAGLTGPIADGDYSTDRLVRLAGGLMEKLGLRRFAVVGASSGGPTAFRCAAAYADRVTALVLMNSAGIARGNQAATRPGQPRLGAGTLADVTEASLAAPLRAVTNNSPAITDALVRRKFDFARIDGRVEQAAAIVSQYKDGDTLAVLGRITAPTLIVWGGANKALALSVADQFHAALTHAAGVKKVVFAQGAHVLQLQMPRESGQAASEFLKSHAR